MTELIICEKPKAAQNIARALADKKPEKKIDKKIAYYKLKHKGNDIIVVATVGHVYSLAEKEKKWEYPKFDIIWKPSYEVSKSSSYTKKYLELIKKIAKKADSFTVACDYDIEGETIGVNIIKNACRQKDASRMKFSTLTKQDIVKAYESKSNTLDWGQAKSGLVRHKLDWYYGVNISRALMSALKKVGMWNILSAGRVQGPALKVIVDREKEIKRFKPEPYWQIELLGTVKDGDLSAWHVDDKIFKRKRAEEIMQAVEGRPAVVESVKRKEYFQSPPVPFDLTTLQTESYRCFKISPKETLDIAQNLYVDGLISYPRTSSQQLPPSIGYKNIMEQLADHDTYAVMASRLLKGKLQPNNGKKTDPAHPAIYPTGVNPKKIDGKKEKVYDLVVRRFLATFADPAVRERLEIIIDVNNEKFLAKGSRTVKPEWHEFYKYVRLKEDVLPDAKRGEAVKVNDIILHDKETSPPKRYTQASIIKELENKNLGTKATRAGIVDTLYQRNYVVNDPIEATELGIKTLSVLEKYVPEIVDEELTRQFELEMEGIQEGKNQPEEVTEKAKKFLTKVLTRFKKKEKEVGEALQKATQDTRQELTELGRCNKCEGDLVIRKGRFGMFVACNNYPDCKNTFTLPGNALVKPAKKECGQCGMPLVTIIRKAKRPQEVCISPDCPSKKVDASNFREKQCPRCKEGTVKIRPGFFGEFAACDSYPKCRYTENIE